MDGQGREAMLFGGNDSGNEAEQRGKSKNVEMIYPVNSLYAPDGAIHNDSQQDQ